jgi:hypothetical protein
MIHYGYRLRVKGRGVEITYPEYPETWYLKCANLVSARNWLDIYDPACVMM